MTEKINYKNNSTYYHDTRMMQVFHITSLLEKITNSKNFSRAIEIGTAYGGFTNLLADFFDSVCTFDIQNYNANFYEHKNIEYLNCDLHNIENIEKYLLPILKRKGNNVIFVDGGDKALEANLISEYIKPGDLILCHDFSIDIEDFNTRGKSIWNCLECRETDLDLTKLKRSEFFDFGLNFAWGIYEKNNIIRRVETNKIGLSMIVKNESKVIKRCLDSVKEIIDYVCISDTGSTDNTVEIIENWLEENNIKGEVIKEQWENFATNRSRALTHLRKHKDIDYVLVIDADEILVIDKDFNLKKFKDNLKQDLYFIICKFSNIEYARTSIFKNSKPFYYKGIIHEFLECKDFFTKGSIDGLYNIPLQDSARNEGGQKFEKDAVLLKNALEYETDEFLKTRYTFYLAQSYRDSGEKGKAIYWYNKRVEQGGWDQEVYWSLYQIACLKESLKYPEDDIVQSYLRAYEKCTSRIEALHNAIKFCRTHNRNHQAYMIGKHALTLPVCKQGLFVETWIWDYGLKDEFSIACYWSGHYKEGLGICEELLHKSPESYKARINQNINFFKQKLNMY
jgi:hypothetical protein